MLQTANEKKLRNDLDYHLERLKFPIHEKNSEGKYHGDISLTIGAGFAMAWRKNQQVIDYLLSELDKRKTADEMRTICEKIETNTHFNKLEEKHHTIEKNLHEIMWLTIDKKDTELFKEGIKRKFKLITHGLDESEVDAMLSTKEAYRVYKGTDKEKPKREVKKMFMDELNMYELMLVTKQMIRKLDHIADYSQESILEYEMRMKGYQIIRAVGGIKRSLELLKESKINIVSMVSDAERLKAIKLNSAPNSSLYDLYIAVFTVYQNDYVDLFADKNYLKNLKMELVQHLGKLGIKARQGKATRAVKTLLTDKQGKKHELDINDVEFLIAFYDELKDISQRKFEKEGV